MSIYLPIAELPIDIFILALLGGVGGIMAGIFGIGGGFLITPILIFIGIPPAVAVATSANQIIASSVTGFLAQWHRNNVDIKMGLMMLIGGLIGALLGIQIFTILKNLGQIDIAISLIYVAFLGTIGSLMFYESGMLFLRQKGYIAQSKTAKKEGLFYLMGFGKLKILLKSVNLPYVTHFPKSNITISALIPITLGVVAGMLVSLMGIGGGFIMIPAMIYLIRMPANLVVGTSLFQIIFVTSLVTILHAITTNTVDIVLAAVLIFGGVIGAQFGSKIGSYLPAERMRLMLSVIILILCISLGVGLFIEPAEKYLLTAIE